MCVEVLCSEELTALQLAFEKACAELGLSNTPSDKGRLEHLAMLMVSLIEEGEANLAAVSDRRAGRQSLTLVRIF